MQKTGLFIFITSVFLAVNVSTASAQTAGRYGPEGDVEDWTVIESNFATIFVDKDLSVKRVSGRIDVGFARYDPIEKQLFLDKGQTDEDKLANKIDIIIRKVKKILDMYPEGYHIRIRVYEDEEHLWEVYEDIFKERKEYKAFYIHRYETVYIPIENVSENILAHELGHSVIDTYFRILPPEKIRELLACYCDVHLKD